MYLKEIKISTILSETKETAVNEGWGGKHIKFFPPFNFYQTYIYGKKVVAKNDMIKWYYNRLVRQNLCVVPKAQGGMLGGSLFRIIKRIHKSKGIDLKIDLSNAEEALIIQGIEEKVENRFKLLRSIRDHSYQDTGDVIYLKRTGNYYAIVRGHHRIAAMAACGHSSIKGTTKKNILLRIIKKIDRRYKG